MPELPDQIERTRSGLAEEIIQGLEERGVPAGAWLIDASRTRSSAPLRRPLSTGADDRPTVALPVEPRHELVVSACKLVLELLEPGLKVTHLGVDRPRQLAGRRRHELDAHGVEDLQEHGAGRIVPLELPAPDVPPVGADGVRQLVLREPGAFAKLAKPVPERRVGSCRRTPFLRHSKLTVRRGAGLVQASFSAFPLVTGSVVGTTALE